LVKRFDADVQRETLLRERELHGTHGGVRHLIEPRKA
jgi:hypothetical protein